MRTTVTLDKDVERMMHEEMHRSRRSFKQTLNSVLRSAMAGKILQPKASRFVVKARPMRLRAGIDPTSFNMLADELEVDALYSKARRSRT